MIAAFLAFFQAIPSLVRGIETFTKAHYDAKVKMLAARIGGDVEAAKAMLLAEAQINQTKVGWLQVVANSPFLWLIVGGFAAPYIIYEWRCIVYDIVIMGGTTATDPIKGNLAEWGDTIIKGIFVTTTGVGAVQAWVNRK